MIVTWELTTWGRLIDEVIKDPDTPPDYLPEVPKEKRARSTNLYYSVTGLDAWGRLGAVSKEKCRECYMTPERWQRNSVMLILGGTASRTGTAIRPGPNSESQGDG